MSRKPPPVPSGDGEFWVRITRNAAWGWASWYVKIGHGVYSWGPDGGGWFTWTRNGAINKAIRKIRAMERALARENIKIEWKGKK